MDSGANGLFEALADPLFAAQQGSTYFAIEFGDWLVLGLDSAYYAHTPLPDPQVPPQTHRVLNGFATVQLGGRSITERFYEQGIDNPVWEETTTF